MAAIVHIEINVSREEYERLLKRKGNKSWRQLLLDCSPSALENFGIINDVQLLAIDILQGNYAEAKEISKKLLAWIEERLKEKGGTTEGAANGGYNSLSNCI